MQLGMGVYMQALAVQMPQSRSADLAAYVKNRPDLSHAIIIADPDYLVEPLPYYLPNRVFYPRPNHLGGILAFTKAGKLDLTLGDLLACAQAIHKSFDVPVIVLIEKDLETIHPGERYHEGYNWSLSASSEKLNLFRRKTQVLARFGPAMDETYTAYLLK